MIRQVIISGSFFDAGVKKLATAFFVVVDSTLRFFKGGGDKDASLAFASSLPACFAVMILNTCAEQGQH